MPLTSCEQPDQLKGAAVERVPAEVLGVFERTTQDLVHQGLPSDAGNRLDPLTLEDATADSVSLDHILQSGPALIVFYRGGWCPYCNLALRAYQSTLLPQPDRFGARFVAIRPQSPDESLSTTEKAAIPFTGLSDPGSRLAQRIRVAFQQADEVLTVQRQLGVDLALIDVEGAIGLPRPTVMVVDRDRVVHFVDVQPMSSWLAGRRYGAVVLQ